MQFMVSLLRYWRQRADSTGLEVAQVTKLQGQVAPLYALLAFSAAALAFTHRDVAPAGLTLFLPGVLILGCLIRLARWLSAGDATVITQDQAVAKLKSTTLVAGVLAVAFVSWAIALDQYGNAYQQGHVAIFIAITVLGVISCLGYHPKAARLVWLIVIGTFSTYGIFKDSDVATAIVINIALVSGLILKVITDSFVAFMNLELSRAALERKQEEAQVLSEQNAALAQTDSLTSLPNRRAFFAELERHLDLPNASIAVGLIDLDGFKPINDTYGHAQGDRLLRIIAARLKEASGQDITVARLGGDEFGILVKLGPQDALVRGQALCDAVRVPVDLSAACVTVGCSMGLASFPEAGKTVEDLFDRADLALYHAKDQRRGGCVIFSAELEDVIRAGQRTATAFQTANLERELSVVFQPIFDLKCGTLMAVEALARWNSPMIGAVPPEQLISAAERVGLARQTTTELFRKALTGASKLPKGIRLTFNLSALDVSDENTVEELLSELEMSEFCASNLVFELTENCLITDIAAVRISLMRLKSSGASLALDDFGTGYSSLSLLHELPFDVLKIDRSFAAQLGDPTGRRLATAIRGLADTLSLRCVLEGIETCEQLMEAKAAGFEYAQGYYLARPAAIDYTLSLLNNYNRAA